MAYRWIWWKKTFDNSFPLMFCGVQSCARHIV